MIDPDMPTQELRLHMGELTNDEVRVARAAIRWANRSNSRVTLFRDDRFTSHSGLDLPWRIECDALSPEDWDTIGKAVARRYMFCEAIGIPRGGIPFAEALNRHKQAEHHCNIVVVDDVITTGNSMLQYMQEIEKKYPDKRVFGIALFARRGFQKFGIETVFQVNHTFEY